MKEKYKDLVKTGQSAMLALKYLSQYIEPKTYNEIVKQVKTYLTF